MKNTSLPGFSLIELALVLIVIGILTGAVFKGQDVLEAAKIRAVLNDIDRLRNAAALYHDTFGQWPGNDSQARSRFGEGVTNGRGNGILSDEEVTQFWPHLAKAGYISEETAPPSKLGGNFTVVGDAAAGKNFLVLSGTDKAGLLTTKQAAALKAKAQDGGPTTGHMIITEGVGAAQGSCIQDGTFNLVTKTPACILKVAFE